MLTRKEKDSLKIFENNKLENMIDIEVMIYDDNKLDDETFVIELNRIIAIFENNGLEFLMTLYTDRKRDKLQGLHTNSIGLITTSGKDTFVDYGYKKKEHILDSNISTKLIYYEIVSGNN